MDRNEEAEGVDRRRPRRQAPRQQTRRPDRSTSQTRTRWKEPGLYEVTLFDHMVTFEMPLDVAMICYILWMEDNREPVTVDLLLHLQVPYWIAVGYAQAKDLIPDPKGTKEAYYTLLNAARARYTEQTGKPVT